MVRPSKSPVTTPFGQVPGYPLNNGFHKGVDFSPVPDSTIYAAEAGVVTLTPNDGTLGNSIHMYIGNHHHAYGHTSKYLVANGTRVAEGQPIAVMGATGAADGVHLHWALAIDGVLVNGLDYVTEGEDVADIANEGDVKNIYFAVLHRDPSDKEVAERVASGISVKDLFYSCKDSKEFQVNNFINDGDISNMKNDHNINAFGTKGMFWKDGAYKFQGVDTNYKEAGTVDGKPVYRKV